MSSVLGENTVVDDRADRVPFTGHWPLGEDELSALAISSVVGEIDDSAIPWKGAWGAPGVVGDWYMPSSSARLHNRWATIAVVTVILGFLIIDAFGLCITSGVLSLA